jgi:hypothetical protein
LFPEPQGGGEHHLLEFAELGLFSHVKLIL